MKMPRFLTAVAVASTLALGAGSASAGTNATAAINFNNDLLALLSVFGVTVSATGPNASFSAGTFSSSAADVLAGDTTFDWAANSGLAFTVAGNGTLTFDTLVYDAATSKISSSIHFVNGATTQEFGTTNVFNVGALSQPFATLVAGGTTQASLALSAAGLAAVASALNITVAPTSDLPAGNITFVTTPVPEPETWGLALGGLMTVAAAAVVRRRRQG